MKTPTNPPRPGTTPPRNSFGPRDVLAILDRLARRQRSQEARLSPLTRLGRGAA